MQLQAVWGKIGIGVSVGLLLASGHAQAQVQALSPTNDHVLCAAYMDIAVKDLYPLGGIPHAKARDMLVGRLTRLSAVTLSGKGSVSDVVSAFITTRNDARLSLVKSSGLNAMRLYTPSQINSYAKNLDNKVTKHCTSSNKEIEKLMNTYTTKDFVAEVVVVSSEMESRGVDGESARESDEIDSEIDVDTNDDYDYGYAADDVVVEEPAQ